MDMTKNAATPATNGNCPPEVGMESRGNMGEPSYAKAETEGGGTSRLNTQNLLLKILECGNLNEAYKRVRQNDGSSV